MKPLTPATDLARRAFLKRGLWLGATGAAAPLALNLSLLADAVAATAPGDYKALVCVFLYGGNDHGNTLVPVDATHYAQYAAIRGAAATAQSALSATALTPAQALPDGLQYALAPQLAPLKSVWDAGRLAVQLNVGPLIVPTTVAQYQARSVPLPPKLMSHNDQQSIWQSDLAEGATSGWRSGRAADRQPTTFTVDAQRGLAHADRHALAVLAAHAHAGVELHVVADHRDARQRVRAVADDAWRP
jgi:uncharacterized protein (DUF1501 family)